MPKMYSRVTLSEKMCMHWSIHSSAHVVPVLPRLKQVVLSGPRGCCLHQKPQIDLLIGYLIALLSI